MPDRKDWKPTISAGIVLYRAEKGLEVLLAHFGGPKWEKVEKHCWTIPKGIVEYPEEPYKAALREFGEETGTILLPSEKHISLGSAISPQTGKTVMAWAAECPQDYEPVEHFQSNTCRITDPSDPSNKIVIGEVSKIQWFPIGQVTGKVLDYQLEFFARLLLAFKR